MSVTVTRLRSEPAVTVVCGTEVLCFYCHSLCSTDKAGGLLVWCLNDSLRVDFHKADTRLRPFR